LTRSRYERTQTACCRRDYFSLIYDADNAASIDLDGKARATGRGETIRGDLGRDFSCGLLSPPATDWRSNYAQPISTERTHGERLPSY
jgi:hypothetical protein